MDFGFVRVGAAAPMLKVADCEYNAEKIVQTILEAQSRDIQFVVFPELSITAYTCGDLFHQQALLNSAVGALDHILHETGKADLVAMVGMPLYLDNQLFNCAVVIQSGRILGVVPKTYIPGYSEFYEERWFASGVKSISDEIVLCGQRVPFGTDLLFEDVEDRRMCFGVEICEDLWVPVPPSAYQSLSGAVLLFNLSASNEVIGKYEYRIELVRQQSGKCVAGYIYTSAGVGESTTDVVFGGHMAVAENGALLAESERFQDHDQLICADIDLERLANDRAKNTCFMEFPSPKRFRKIGFCSRKVTPGTFKRFVDPHPFVPSDPNARDKRCGEIFAIQTAGLGKRLKHTGLRHAVIGVSGGLDSTLALLVTVKAFDGLGLPRSGINAVTMPGFGTTGATYENAVQLTKSVGATLREIDIKNACLQHFEDIGHDRDMHDVTYENVQARERTQVLMDIANKVGGLVIGTGDLSELALGWCTYNGDHMSMYAVNCSIPKTLVRFLIQWIADNMVDKTSKRVLHRILDTPISPELLPPDECGQINQKTEDIIGPYELHDFFLYHAVRYGASPKKVLFLADQAFKHKYDHTVIKGWLKVFYKRFFSQQFKRSCLPDGPKVGTISLSPRGDWRMPSDAQAHIWLKELEEDG
ncbi:MAG: NAD(+) synthase [Clostridiales bacterium]|jgi:NAD+ synthase (glutamine-hydrolysing)|nr:NAD(+) synthase [Eubacteriales bacterium]MDH7565440.1 NAD(+) synthase [Clostridiales bacterium]